MGMRLLPRSLNRSFPRAHILKPVVSAHRNGVLTRRQSCHGKLIRFRSAVADAMCRREQNPLAAVYTVLCFFDAARRIRRRELHKYRLHSR